VGRSVLHSQPQSEVECAALARLTLHPYSSAIIFTSFAQIANPNPGAPILASHGAVGLENASKISLVYPSGYYASVFYGEMQAGDSAIVAFLVHANKDSAPFGEFDGVTYILTRIWRILPGSPSSASERLALLRS